MSTKQTAVGAKIRSLRESKGLSQEEIAERSGLAIEQVASIEDNQFLPSLGPLIKIARALGVRLGTFLDDNDELGPVICRRSEQAANNSISFSNDSLEARQNMIYHSLARQKAGRHMEPFIIDIEPNQARDFKLSAHEGEEFIYVLEGQLQIDYGKTVYELNEGDSIFYDSIVRHHVHGLPGKAARILAVIYIPS